MHTIFEGFGPAQVSLCNLRQVLTSLGFSDDCTQELLGPLGSASRASDWSHGFRGTPVPVCEARVGDEGVAGSADSRSLPTRPGQWPLAAASADQGFPLHFLAGGSLVVPTSALQITTP